MAMADEQERSVFLSTLPAGRRRARRRARGRAGVRRAVPRGGAVRATAARVGAGLHPDLRIGAGDQRSGHRGVPVRSDPHLAVAGAAAAGLRLLVHRRADGCTCARPFPDCSRRPGLLGAGPQSTAWLYMFWHGGFPLLVIAYALRAATRHASRIWRSRAATAPSCWRARRRCWSLRPGSRCWPPPATTLLPAIMQRQQLHAGAASWWCRSVWAAEPAGARCCCRGGGRIRCSTCGSWW